MNHHDENRLETESPKRKGKQKKQQQQRTSNHHKQQQKTLFYPRVETFLSEEKQSTQLTHVLTKRGLYDSAEGLRRRQETLEGLEELLNQWSSNSMDHGECASDENNSPPPRVALVSFGSYRLKIHKPGADMDLLAVCPSHCTRADFFTTLVPILKADHRIADVHPIPAAYTPVIKFTMNAIAVDLLFAGLTVDTKLQKHVKGTNYIIDDSDLKDLDEAGVRSLNGARVAQILDCTVPNLETYRTTLRAVKEWAYVHGLYSNVLGFLGGINYAILVACICKRHKDAKPPTLLKAFFQTFSKWKWPTPVTLSHVAYQPPPGVQPLPVWDAKTNPRDRMHIMPILTPTYPSMNSAYNVGIPQLRRLTHALQEGLAMIQEIEEGRKTWDDLFRTNFFHRHAIFLQTNIMASNGPDFLEWFRFVESRLRLLIAGLDNPHYGIQAEPFCNFYDRKYDSKGKCLGLGTSDPSCKTESCLFIGLRLDVDHIDLSYLVGEFLHKVNTWEGRNAGMDLTMETIGRDSLPKFLLESNPTSLMTRTTTTKTTAPPSSLSLLPSDRPENGSSGSPTVEHQKQEEEDTQEQTQLSESGNGQEESSCTGHPGDAIEATTADKSDGTGDIPSSFTTGRDVSSQVNGDTIVPSDKTTDDKSVSDTNDATIGPAVSDTKAVVSWAMKVSGNSKQSEGTSLRAMASPAKRART